MISLLSTSPFGTALPKEIGTVRISEAEIGPVTHLQPHKERSADVSKALRASLGLGFPAPGEALTANGYRALWCGPGQAMLLGEPIAHEHSHTVDVTDAFAAVRIEGAQVRDVLARLTPLDIRPSVFAEGRTARTLLGHMTAQITPVGEEAFEIMVFRSMASTLLHDLARAAGFVEGRNLLS